MRIRFGKFSFDSERRELLRGTETVRLPPKALLLLEVLIARRPKAVSQAELYDALWADAFVEKTNLHNLIYQLRSALDDDDRTLIRTAYGFGFSFDFPAFAEVPKPRPTGWQIVVGDVEYELREGENLVGRERDAAVRIDVRSMSRHHARIIVTPGTVTLEDLGSKNGTYVRGRRIRHIDFLSDGDRIIFGTIAATLQAIRQARSTETVR